MEKLFKKIIVASSIIALVALAIFTLWPIALSIIAGLLLGYVFYPVYKQVFKVVKEKNISSLIIVIVILFIIFIPLWFLFPIITKQLFEAYTYSQSIDFSAIVGKILPESLSVNTSSLINSFISKLVNSVFSSFTDSILNLPALLLQAAVVLFVFFFTMRDADNLAEYINSISPVTPKYQQYIIHQFKEITNAVIYGFIITGIIQGLLTGIGIWIFGVPQVLLLTLLAVLVSIIPVIGAWLVWLPASIYLIISGHTGAGIGLFLYGAIFVSWIDNIIRPYIVSRRAKISSAVVFVGMLGGLIVFGLLGLVIGPLVLAYLLIVLDAYRNKKLGEFFSSD